MRKYLIVILLAINLSCSTIEGDISDENKYFYIINFYENYYIDNNVSYKINENVFVHSDDLTLNLGALASSESVIFELQNKRLKENFSNFTISKMLFDKLRNNNSFVVWKRGAEIEFDGKFYLQSSDSSKIKLFNIEGDIPFSFKQIKY